MIFKLFLATIGLNPSERGMGYGYGVSPRYPTPPRFDRADKYLSGKYTFGSERSLSTFAFIRPKYDFSSWKTDDGVSTNASVDRKIRYPNWSPDLKVLPVTAKAYREHMDSIEKDNITMYGLPAAKVVIVGVVKSCDMKPTNLTVVVDDNTGSLFRQVLHFSYLDIHV